MSALNKQLPLEKNKRIIIAALSDTHAAAERTALKHAGLRDIHIYTSGVLLAEYLAKATIGDFKRQEIVFCQNQMTDMSAINFFHLIRKHPLLVHQPLVGIGGNISEVDNLEKNGFEIVLTRPYNVKDLEKIFAQCEEFESTKRAILLKQIQETGKVPSSSHFFQALEEFNQQLQAGPEEISAQAALYEAMLLLKAGDKEKAMPLLLKATVEEETAGQAYMVLATLYRDTDLVLYEKNILHALRLYTLTGNDQKLFETAEYYKVCFPTAEHPLMRYMNLFINKGKVFEAAKMLGILNSIYPMEPYIKTLAQLCQESINPTDSLKVFKEVLADSYPEFIRKFTEQVDKINKEAPKTLFFSSKKKKEAQQEKKQEKTLVLKEEERTGEFDFSLDSSLLNSQWGEMPHVPDFDEDMAYDASLNPKKSNQLWGIVKGTALMYKNSRKK